MDQEYDNIFDIDVNHIRHRLKEPIDIKRLLKGDGISFELEEQGGFLPDDEMEDEGPFQEKDFLDGLNECGLISDESDEEEDVDPNDLEAVEAARQRREQRRSEASLFDRKRAKMVDITDGQKLVYKRLVQTGEGPKIPDGALVYYHYRMYIEGVDEPFDSTRFRRRPERQRVGVQQILEGMEIALLSMRKKERSVFLMHYDLMYGELGCDPRIPKKSEIYAEIEVLDFVEKNEMETYFDLTPEEREQCSYEQVINVVKQCRNDGNVAFRSNRYAAALAKYRRSRDVLVSVFVKDEAEDKQRNKELIKILLNIAICFKKLNRGPLCIKTCNEVLDLDPNNVKAHYLKGVSLTSLSEFDRASRCLKRAIDLQPHARDILNAIDENNRRAEDFLELDRMRCKRMLNIPPLPGKEKKEEPSADDLSTEFANHLTISLDDFINNPKETTFPDFDTKTLNKKETLVLSHLASQRNLTICHDGDMWSLRKKSNN